MASAVYITLINIILIFISFLILYNRINKKSAPSIVEEYTREVERLIVELNRAVEDVLNISEERIQELKKLLRKVERLLRKPEVKELIQRLPDEKTVDESTEESFPDQVKNTKGLRPGNLKNKEKGDLASKIKHLISMGYSREEICRILDINRAEVDLLLSLYR